jgi:hypothetical protein
MRATALSTLVLREKDALVMEIAFVMELALAGQTALLVALATMVFVLEPPLLPLP